MAVTKWEVARLMAIWVCHSRHDLRGLLHQGVEGFNDAAWQATNIPQILADDPASQPAKQELVSLFNAGTQFDMNAYGANSQVDQRWDGADCPRGSAIAAALSAIRDDYNV